MTRTLHIRPLVLAFVMLFCMTAAYAGQSGRAGGIFSLNGAGLSYSHDIGRQTFYQMDLEVDYSHAVFKERTAPGVIARFGYNKVFKGGDTKTCSLRFYGGTGVMLGYTTCNFSGKRGFVAGLTGTVGMEYTFEVPVTLSLGMTPYLGVQLNRREDNYRLEFNLDGVTYAFLPIIGIRYNF